MNQTSQYVLRNHMRVIRNTLPTTQCQIWSQLICTAIAQHQQYTSAQTIAAYWPVGNEVDIRPIIQCAQKGQSPRTRIALPRIVSTREPRMAFHAYNEQHLSTNRYGIKEPSTHCTLIDINEIDLILMPLVGFDAQGHRIGMGGGFYDRYLQHNNLKPYRMGIAYTALQLPSIEPQPWDVKLNCVVTELGSISFD